MAPSMDKEIPRIEKGMNGEELVVSFLRRKGWRIIARNWRSRRGEMDIVAEDVSCGVLVAVEVKSWWDTSWCVDELRYAVSPYKRIKIRRCFSDFLACHPQLGYHSYRIDAVCIHKGRISHFQGV